MIKSYKLRRFLANAFIYILLAVLGLIWISPLCYLVLHSFRDEGLAYVSYLIPKKLSFQNYIDLFTVTSKSSMNFPSWFMNTFIVAILNIR